MPRFINANFQLITRSAKNSGDARVYKQGQTVYESTNNLFFAGFFSREKKNIVIADNVSKISTGFRHIRIPLQQYSKLNPRGAKIGDMVKLKETGEFFEVTDSRPQLGRNGKIWYHKLKVKIYATSKTPRV